MATHAPRPSASGQLEILGYQPMEEVMKYSNFTLGQIEAIINRLGGEAAAHRFLRGELEVSPSPHSWYEEGRVIHFSVTSDGTTGEDWNMRLKDKGCHVGYVAEQVLHSDDFIPTCGVTTKIAVLKGNLFGDHNRITRTLRTEAAKRKLTAPNAEVACLIREKFTTDDFRAMGLAWITTMHQPISASNNERYLYAAGLSKELGAFRDKPSGSSWNCDGGFAFAVS